MKKLYQVIIISLIINIAAKAQPLPVSVDTAIHVNYLMQVQRNGVRITKCPIDQAMYYATYSGNIYKILKNGSVYSDSLVASVTQHYINYLQGIVFRDSAMYLVGNHKTPNTAGYGLVIRGKFKPNKTYAWDTLLHTATYQSTATLFDHAFSSICLSPAGDSIYIGSGSRTDHGEVETSNNLFPNTRDVPLTSKIFRIPANPATTIYLPNDSATLDAGPYVYCRGVRNSFDIAFASNGDILATENSGDRDDPEELNHLVLDKHYGFPWKMGGNFTPMQFNGYDPNTDKLINHHCLSWGNGTTTNKFYNDLSYPQVPPGLTFQEPVINYGPDADKFRDLATGSVRDASNEGTFITSFTAHRSPLGLVFDNAGKLAAPYAYSAFMLSYTTGSADSTGTLPNNGTGPFSDMSEDLLQLALFKDSSDGQYSMNCYKVATQFKKPVDAYLDDNVLYVLESHYPNDTIPPKLYTLTFPSNSNGATSPFLPKDTVICSGNNLTIIPNLKGKYNYLWSTGATTAQLTVAPTNSTNYWLLIYNGIITIRDSITVTVVKNPVTPGTITTTGGITKVCPGDNRTYTVPLVSGIIYNWIVPTGAVINSGQGTRSINVTYNSGFTANGILGVTANNSCGSSIAKNLTIARNVPATPGAITGTTYGLCGAIEKIYSVTNVPGITYVWTIPATATLISGQGTNNITVTFPSSNFTGTISVKASNACGISAARNLTVRAVPSTVPIINGPATVCQNSSGYAYNIAAIATATNYTWTGPGGSHITGNGITSSLNVLTTTATAVTVNYATLTNTSVLKVRANNNCGAGGTRSLSLIICTPRTGFASSNNINSVYPNPANEWLHLVFNESESAPFTIIVHDMLGKELLNTVLQVESGQTEYPINLNSLNSGLYVLTIRSLTEDQNFKILKE